MIAQTPNISTDGAKPDILDSSAFKQFVDFTGVLYKKLSPTPDGFDDFVEQVSTMWSTQPDWHPSDLSAIHVPVTIMLGDHDEAIKREHTQLIARSVPNAKLVLLKEVGHFAMLQDPDRYNRLVRQGLDPVRP